MSHAKIYQISMKPIKRDDYVEPDDFYDNHDSYADWVGDEVEGKERRECIKYLAKDLREIFDLNGDTLVYKGKTALRAFKQKWADAIKEKAQEITVDNVVRHTPRTTVRDFVNCTHRDSADRFCIKDWSGTFAEPMAELISYIHEYLRKGQRLYIGAVIDFHY